MPTELKGVGEMRKALRKFTPDLNKALSKELRGLLSPIAQKSRGYIVDNPMRNWTKDSQKEFPAFDVQAARRGIGYKTTEGRPNKSGFKSLAELYNKSASGSIYETAGRKTESQFTRNLEAKSAMIGAGKLRGRAMFRAFREDSGKTQGAVIKAFKAARDRFNGKGLLNG